MYWQNAGTLVAVFNGVAFILALFSCVILHEFGHALTARRYGIATRDITLLPIGGVARLESMPENPRHEILIALAGPAVNLFIALLLWLLMPGESDRIQFTEESIDKDLVAGGSMLLQLMTINLILGVFNLLPAFPMDGGRVLRATLSLYMPHLRATRLAASIGQGLAFGLGFLGLMGNPWLVFIAIFIWIGAAGEAGYAEMKSIISEVPVRRAMLTEFHTLAEDDSLGHVVNLTLEGSQKDFPVLRGQTMIGVLTQERLLTGLRESGELGVVGIFMSQEFAEANIDENLEEVFKRFQTTACKLIAVKENSRLSGIINYDNISELISLTKAISDS